MKRNLSNVTRDHVKRLKGWLEAEDKDYCPFRDNGRTCLEDICWEVFPFLDDQGLCPCTRSGFKYVTSVAREIIKKCQR